MKSLLKQVWTYLLILAVMPLKAENYPYRSDVLWVTVPDHADWLYETGEQAEVEIQFYKYGIPQDEVEVTYELGSDMMPADKSGKVTLKNGRAVIRLGTMKEPGYTQQPADFNEFWEKAMEEAARCPMKYTIEPAPEYATETTECYLVKLQCFRRGTYIYGYLTRPKAAGSYPVVLCPPGAGIKTIKEPKRHIYYAEKGYIRFEMEIHGLNPKMTTEEFKEISSAFGNYLTYGIDNRDNYYMKKVYLACVRAVDYLTSLPDWDGKNVIVQGGSQGGALALVTAGLDKRVTGRRLSALLQEIQRHGYTGEGRDNGLLRCGELRQTNRSAGLHDMGI